MAASCHPQRCTRTRFGPYELDLENRKLTADGKPLKLQIKPFQVLQLLLVEPGKLVPREDLRQCLWPADTFVDFEAGLNTAISKLREALQDDPKHPRYVETVQRYGYRFIAPVETVYVDDRSTAIPAGSPELMPLAAWRTYRMAIVVLLSAALLLVVALLGLRYRHATKSHHRIQSIVVLPLENLSGDPAQQYLADGLTEELITDLGKISELRVISRTSAMRYRDTRKSLREIGRELNVDAVIEGGVLNAGNRVRVTTQLVEIVNDRHLWAESYERDLKDALALQDEVARDIVRQIQIKLSPQAEIGSASPRVFNPGAQEAYLQGRYALDKWSEDGLQTSINHFERALRLDPGFSQAWAGLSDAYFLMGAWGYWPSQFSLPKASEAALKAVELDPRLSDGHLSLVPRRFFLEHSWSAAEAELRQAIALNPSNATAHQTHGYFLMAVERFDEAISEMRVALKLDPLSPNKQGSLANALYTSGQYDEALKLWVKMPDPDANSERRHRKLAAIYERKGMYKEAIDEFAAALKLAGKDDLARQLAKAYASSGYASVRRTVLLRDLKETQQRRAVGLRHDLALEIAANYALLGQKETAFQWLNMAFEEGDAWLLYLKVDPNFEALRSDPRFNDLVRRLGLLQ